MVPFPHFQTYPHLEKYSIPPTPYHMQRPPHIPHPSSLSLIPDIIHIAVGRAGPSTPLKITPSFPPNPPLLWNHQLPLKSNLSCKKF